MTVYSFRTYIALINAILLELLFPCLLVIKTCPKQQQQQKAVIFHPQSKRDYKQQTPHEQQEQPTALPRRRTDFLRR